MMKKVFVCVTACVGVYVCMYVGLCACVCVAEWMYENYKEREVKRKIGLR